jgi:Zn finger protein HypA/HybF involved in hydrogenase expression
MDTGLWTLKCQNCKESFSLELTPGQRIIEHARESACPNCHTRPDDVSGKEALERWHRIIGFKALKRG